jgi:hypothetical protein
VVINWRKILLILGLLLVIAAIPATVYLLQQRQELRKEASTPSGTVVVKLEPESGTFAVGDQVPFIFKFNPFGTSISGISIRLGYTYRDTSPPLIFEEDSIAVNSELTQDSWICPVKRVVDENGQYFIEIACASTSPQGYSANEDKLLASFTGRVQVRPSSGGLTLEFDPAESIFTDTATMSDVLLTPSSKGVYTISGTGGGEGQPPPAEVPVSLNLSSGATLSTGQPTFTGGAAPSAKIEIKVESPAVTGETTSATDGVWRWTSSQPLTDGEHTITVTSTDALGRVSTVTRSFIIKTAAAQGTGEPPTTWQTTPRAGAPATPSGTLPPSATPSGTVPPTAFELPTSLLLLFSSLLIFLGLVII